MVTSHMMRKRATIKTTWTSLMPVLRPPVVTEETRSRAARAKLPISPLASSVALLSMASLNCW